MNFEHKRIEQENLVGVLVENPSYEDAKAYWDQVNPENNNVFVSWIWIGPWLKLIHDKVNTNLFLVYENEKIVAAVFLILHKEKRHKFVTSRQVFLNEICANRLNMVIEYNQILIAPGYELPVTKLFTNFLELNKSWDEIVFNAVESEKFKLIQDKIGLEFEIVDTGVSRQAQLEQGKYNSSKELKQSLLSSNKRSQINRSIKYIEKLYDEITISSASNQQEAIDYFERMKELHTEYWQKKGLPGAFANNNWVNFNIDLIKNEISNNQVDILKITAGDFTIGYLYNLVYKNKVYNIQSGFNYLEDNKFKPGFIAHWLAIEYYWKNNIDSYDFLAGGEEYKKSFANSEIDLVWAKLKRPKLTFKIESVLKSIKRLIS